MPATPLGTSQMPDPPQPPAAPEIVGQYVPCPYCGHPVPVLQHACIKVRLEREEPWLTPLKEKIKCTTCKSPLWKVWSKPVPPRPPPENGFDKFIAWLARNLE